MHARRPVAAPAGQRDFMIEVVLALEPDAAIANTGRIGPELGHTHRLGIDPLQHGRIVRPALLEPVELPEGEPHADRGCNESEQYGEHRADWHGRKLTRTARPPQGPHQARHSSPILHTTPTLCTAHAGAATHM